MECRAYNTAEVNYCAHCSNPSPKVYRCVTCDAAVLKIGDDACLACGTILDDISWDMIFQYNGTSPSDHRTSGSYLDNSYCMRCGDEFMTCTCDVIISERVFSDFMEQLGDTESDIYADSWGYTDITCFDCAKQCTAECMPLIDLIHDVINASDTTLDELDQRDLKKFPKLQVCDDFVTIQGG